jgi:hypothetical protein
MGKVGSSSVEKALRCLSPDYSINRVHTLRRDRFEHALASYRKTYSVRRVLPEHLVASRLLLRDLTEGQPRSRWKVITLVRDPIARNISSFFQDIELRHPSFHFSQRVVQQSTSALVNDLTKLFLSEHDHDEPIEWFERELEGALGIDVYDKPFNPESGFQTYSSPRADLLLFRVEGLADAWSRGLYTLLQRPAPPLPMTNVSAEKPYAVLYRLFKDRLTLPRSYLARMYNSAFARHFYSNLELEGFRKRWGSKYVSISAYVSSLGTLVAF